MNRKNNNQELIRALTDVLSEIKTRLEITHPRSAISLLTTKLSSLSSAYHSYELFECVRLAQSLRHLFDMYFEKNISALSGEELADSSMLPEFKSMIRRELRGLSADRHFDYDYVLQSDNLIEDMTTFKGARVVGEEDYKKAQGETIKSISRATDRILDELEQTSVTFLETAREQLKSKKTISALEDVLRRTIKAMHSQLMGWP